MDKRTGGAGVAKVSRGPFYLDGKGAMLIDMAGACWVLPEFYDQQDGVLLTTLKTRLGAQILTTALSEKDLAVDTTAATSKATSATPRGGKSPGPTPRDAKSKGGAARSSVGGASGSNAKGGGARRSSVSGATSRGGRDAAAAMAAMAATGQSDDVATDLWCADVFKDLFSAGAPLSVLSLETAEREKYYACAMGGRVERFVRSHPRMPPDCHLRPPLNTP